MRVRRAIATLACLPLLFSCNYNNSIVGMIYRLRESYAYKLVIPKMEFNRNEKVDIKLYYGHDFHSGAIETLPYLYRFIVYATYTDSSYDDGLCIFDKTFTAQEFATPESKITHSSKKIYLDRPVLNAYLTVELDFSKEEYENICCIDYMVVGGNKITIDRDLHSVLTPHFERTRVTTENDVIYLSEVEHC